MTCNTTNAFDDDAEVNFSVGRRFLWGNGVDKDVAKAKELLTLAAASGHRLAAQLLDTLKDEQTVPSQSTQPMVETDLFRLIAETGYVEAGSEAHKLMHTLAANAQRLTMEINTKYHEHDELVSLFSQLTGSEIDPSFGLFPPFYTDCGRNIHIGKNVFINYSCHFQDQGGIYIGDGCLIGHNAMFATINHDENPNRRGSMYFKPIRLGKNVWLGANVTICPGVTIGDGAIVAAASVVTKDVAANTVVGGTPAKYMRDIKQ